MVTISPTMDRRQLPDRRAILGPLPRTHTGLGAVDYIALALLVIGGLNWAMVGLFNIDVIASVFGVRSPGTRLLYILAGAAALYAFYMAVKMRHARMP